MAKIKTFRAIRPAKGWESRIAALPYDVYNRAEARAYVEEHQDSFLKLDRPETFFPEGQDMYAPQVYQKASEELQRMLADGRFVKEEAEGYYLYELTMEGRSQTGIVACASLDDYENGIIKKHENTREEKEKDRICHIDVCNVQTGPIFLAYRENAELRGLIADVKAGESCFDFTSEDGIRHRGWTIFEKELTERIRKAFAGIEHIYIADGHHRAASAVKVGQKRRMANPGYTGGEEYNYFLSVLFAEEELKILDYNRVVKDLNGYSTEDFLNKISTVCQVTKEEQAVRPIEKGEIGMYLKDTWYRLKIKPEFTSPHPVEGLDVSVLQKEILQPVLGIGDPRTDHRIDFVGGIRGLSELEKRVGTDCAVAFSMYPTSMQELFTVADAGMLMPPKSTWFEPKLRSGLFLHSLEE